MFISPLLFKWRESVFKYAMNSSKPIATSLKNFVLTKVEKSALLYKKNICIAKDGKKSCDNYLCNFLNITVYEFIF